MMGFWLAILFLLLIASASGSYSACTSDVYSVAQVQAVCCPGHTRTLAADVVYNMQ